LRKPPAGSAPIVAAALAEPSRVDPGDRIYGILITGIGGTGVVTLGALLGMAAHLDGKQCATLDMTGLAQKGGAVLSHVQIANSRDRLHAVQIGPGQADLLLGCDLVVSAEAGVLAAARPGTGYAVINTHESITGEQALRPDLAFPANELRQRIATEYGAHRIDASDANEQAMRLFGDATFANILLLGRAFQKGVIPISAHAIEQAIRLNGVSVEQNLAALHWGRRLAAGAALPATRQADSVKTDESRRLSPDLDEAIQRRALFLERSRDAGVAERYRALVERARAAERPLDAAGLADAVARGYFKLLAYKDEYEIARLYADPAFLARVAATFEGDYRLRFHLAPPLLTRRDPVTRKPTKRAFGPWMLTAFRVLARLKALRGTPFDPFGYLAERRTERQMIADYEAALGAILANLTRDNHAHGVEIASLPLGIRGFGHVKARSFAAAKAREQALLGFFRPSSPRAAAAE
jgi:indolepyruvate ferredoxin oxidoreductase